MTATQDAATGTQSGAPTTHQGILDFVNEVAAMTKPARIHWCTGSDEEWTELTDALVSTGTFTRLNPAIKPNSFHAASDPIDVARVEDRTYICSVDEKDCGPTNNWMDPDEMKALMRKLYDGCMAGRTMYVIPFVMGHLDAEKPMFGIELTDSAYVTASMRVMARMGSNVLDRMTELDADFVPAIHSVGHPLAEGEADVSWPCNDTKYIVQFPEERAIWSYGSGYGGNALLGKKCYALRIASVMARDEGWLAEHMLILKLTSPEGVVKYIAAAFPSACGKTNLAMLEPDHPRLEGRDPRRRHRLDEDRRGRPAVGGQPRVRLLRRGAGHQRAHQPQRDEDHQQGQLGLHQRRADRGRRHLVGGAGEPARQGHLLEGRALDAGAATSCPATRTAATARRSSSATSSRPSTTTRAASRSTRSCSAVAARPPSRWSSRPATGPTAPSSAPRSRARPPRPRSARSAWCVATRWRCCRSSATTPATTSTTGSRIGKDNDEAKLPRIFYVNWFRRDDEGGFLWPGFGENSRVLKWVVERIEGQAAAEETSIGHVPAPGSLDVDGLDLTQEALAAALAVDDEEWKAEIPQIQEWFEKFGDQLPDRALDRARRPQGAARRLTRTAAASARWSPRPQAGGFAVGGCHRRREMQDARRRGCVGGLRRRDIS